MVENYTINQHSNAGPTIGHHKGDIIANQTVLAGKSFISEADKCRELMEWISPRDFSRVHGEFRSKAVQGTGQWFLDSDEFTSWRDKQTQYLWVSGKAGAGKSFLSSTVIADLQDKEESQVAFLYLTYERDPSVQDLLGNLAGQLVGQLIDSPSLPPTVQGMWSKEKNKLNPFKAPPELSQIKELLGGLVSSNTFFVVDALDEFDASQHCILLNHLRALPQVRLMITSRHHATEGFAAVDIAAHQKDIRVYIDEKISNSRLNHLVSRDEDLKTLIPQKVTEKADGIFLLARLHVNALAACLTTSDVWATLDQLPADREEMYETTLNRINDQDQSIRDWAMTTIGWIVHSNATRPLEVEELRNALPMGGKINSEGLRTEDAHFDHGKMLSKEDILTICCGLVEIQSTRGSWKMGQYDSFRLIHYSTQEFFNARKERFFPDFHSRISLACAKYICIPRLAELDYEPDFKYPYTDDRFGDGPNNYKSEFLEFRRLENYFEKGDKRRKEEKRQSLEINGRMKEYFRHRSSDEEKVYSNGIGVLKRLYPKLKNLLYPLNEYAREFLSYHFQQIVDAQNRAVVEDQIEILLQDEGSRRFYTRLPKNQKIRDQAISHAAFIGSARLVEQYLRPSEGKLLVLQVDLALETAIENHCTDVIRAILSLGDIVDLTTARGHSLLLKSVEKGFFDEANQIIAGILEDLERRRRERNSESRLAQLRDWFVGDSHPSQRMIHHFGQLDPTKISDHITLLSASARGDSVAISDILSKRGFTRVAQAVDIDRIDFRTKAYLLKTSFFLSVESCDTDSVKVFLEHRIDVDIRNFTAQTPLHRAVFRSSLPTVALLLSNEAHLDLQDDLEKTVWAMLPPKQAENERMVVKLLLDYSEDCPLALAYASGALIEALQKENFRLASSLVEGGLDPSTSSPSGEAPIQAAYKGWNRGGMAFLLEHSADPNVLLHEERTLFDEVLDEADAKMREMLNFERASFRASYKRERWEAKVTSRMVKLLRKNGGKTAGELRQEEAWKRAMSLMKPQGMPSFWWNGSANHLGLNILGRFVHPDVKTQ